MCPFECRMSDTADQVTREMELRKLSGHHMHNLASRMDHSRDWSKLMEIIPKDLTEFNLETARFKYTQEHMQMIENASRTGRPPKLPGHILFEEWGTSGKFRPTVAHLLQLLVQANLFRAADYLAEILKEAHPARPQNGPAAPIPMDFDTDETVQNVDHQQPEMSHVCGNEAIVTVEENSNSNAPTLSTNLQSDPSLDGLSDVDLPNLSILKNAAPVAAPTAADNSNTGSNYSSYPYSTDGGGTGSEPTTESTVIESDSTIYQSDVPNISKFGGMTIPGQKQQQQSSQQQIISTISTTNSSSSSASIISESQQSSLSSSTAAATAALLGNSNHSMPHLSYIMKNIQMSDSIDSATGAAATAVASSLSVTETTTPISAVQKFGFGHLVNCTNNFNGDDFTDVASPGRKLGAGGFGSVHLAVNLTTQIPLAAVKRLHKNFDQVAKKFELEREILSQHRHTNLVQLLGYADDSGEMCLIYECVSGGNLEHRLEVIRMGGERRLTARKRLGIALGVARGIDYLHSAGLIHRDVKSANVLLSNGDLPKLCDFGLLRQLNSQSTTIVVGSTGYMAPEVSRGIYHDKMDVFSFGVVQLELLTGLEVISRERGVDLLTYVERVMGQSDDITPLLDSRAGDWGELGVRWYKQIVMKALEYSPDKRSSIKDCINQLENVVQYAENGMSAVDNNEEE